MDGMDPKMHKGLDFGTSLKGVCIVQSHCMDLAHNKLSLM